MKIFKLLLFLFISSSAFAQGDCGNRLDFINFNRIQFHYFTDSSFITPKLTRFTSNDSLFPIPKSKTTASIDWTNGSENLSTWKYSGENLSTRTDDNVNLYGTFSSLMSYRFGNRSRDSGLVIFHNSLGEIRLSRIGFYHDSTVVEFGGVLLNNQSSIDDIKELYPCSWKLFQREKKEGWGLFGNESYDPSDFRFTGYDLIRLEISNEDVPDPYPNIYGSHIILYFDNAKLVCLEVYHGS